MGYSCSQGKSGVFQGRALSRLVLTHAFLPLEAELFVQFVGSVGSSRTCPRAVIPAARAAWGWEEEEGE